MRRIAAALAMGLGMALATPAASMTIEEQLLASLRAQGYEILEEGYTFLGRLRIVASNGEIRREIVVNPGTGEILRDYAVYLPRVAGQAPTSGSGKGQATAGVSAGADAGAEPPQTGVLSSIETPGADATSALETGEDVRVLMLTPVLPLSDVTQ